MQNDAIQVAVTRDADLLRNFLIKRVIYALEDLEDPQAFEALDSATGAIPQALSWSSTLWWLDPSDTSTAHDGVTTLVTDDGYRYKASGVSADIRSVLSRAETDPPVTPEIGDAYLVASGATGDWSSHNDDVAVFTARGWAFIPPKIGWWLYVEDEDVFVRYDAAGAWSAGQGARTFDANSIPISALINGGRTSFIVENQTTNTPPSSPTVPVAYIIGSSPTGVWLGKAGQIAVCEIDGQWTYYVPSNGYQAFDKATNSPVRYNGSSWVSGAGAWVGYGIVKTASGSTTAPTGSTIYLASTTAPTTSARGLIDNATLTYSAKRSGAKLRFAYSAGLATSVVSGGSVGADGPPTIALFRDSETTAIAWAAISTPLAPPSNVQQWLVIDSADAISHTYTIRLFAGRSSNAISEVTAVSLRQFSVEEGA